MGYIPHPLVSFATHDVARVSSHAGNTLGSPLTLEAHAANGRRLCEMVLFTNDQSLTDELAAAINGVFAKRAKERQVILEAAE